MQSANLRDHVIICGYGRIGSAIGTALETFGIPFFIIENDPDTVKALSSRGLACIFGDPAHPHILEEAGLRKANLVVITLPEHGQAQLAVSNIRRLNPEVPILARAHRSSDREALLQAGANEVIQPELEASAVMLRGALGYLRLSEDQTAAYLERFREAMEALHVQPSITPMPFPEIRELTLADSSLSGQSLRDARIRERFGVTVVAVVRPSGEVVVNPQPETVLHNGDRLRVFGLSEQIETFSAATG
jgi:CPA2 family monovalent cation:H+ antiporter-2